MDLPVYLCTQRRSMIKVLLITYYWPPAGGGGVQRWLKMSKYLPDQGVDLTVYTPENGEFPGYDPSLVEEVDPRINILKHPIWEPYSLFKKFTGKKSNSYNALITEGEKSSWKQDLAVFLRGNFFIPDARCFWIGPSIKYLSQLLETHTYDVIISTGPPHSTHMIALGLKNRFPKIKWVADFRDPWTMIDFYKDLKLTSWADKRHHAMENKVLSTADEIVTISPSCADDLMGLANRPIKVIHNGFDEEDFKNAAPPLDSDFTIVHIGSMNKDRNPRVLWEVLGQLIEKNPGFAQFIKIELVGIVDGSIVESIQKAGLKNQLSVIGQQNHKAVIQRMRSVQILLLPINDIPQQKGVMPGKMYEYLGAARPILAFGLPDSDTAKLLHDTGAGNLFGYNDKKGLEEYLDKAIKTYQSGRLEVSSQGYLRYSRKNLASKYSELLHKLVS